MITMPIGILVIIGTLSYLLFSVDSEKIINAHSIVIVCVGTIGILFLSIPLRNVIGLFHAINDLRKSDGSNQSINTAILQIARNKLTKVSQSIHPLINYAQDLWAQGLESDLIAILLTQRLEELNAQSEQPVASLKNLAKYPPALGMTGTVVGVIALFGSFTEDSKASVGTNLAFAMTATFFGLTLANFVILPLADRLHIRHLSRVKRNESVYHSLLLINQDEPVSVIKNCHTGLNGFKEQVA